MAFNRQQIENSWVYAVFGIAIFLRLFYFWEWSLTNDEISALYRLRYDSFEALITEGIMEDGHPAFVQLFLYAWTAIFGSSPFAVRLPFVLAAIGSCFYLFHLVKSMIGRSAAILSLSFFAISSFFITYGQIARPYSMGLFFILAFAYHALKLIQEKAPKGISIPYVVFGLLAISTHYFASMQAVILGFVFLLFSLKGNWKGFLQSSLVIVILFLPHVPITLQHLSIGGVNWVPLPDDQFLSAFFGFVSNQHLVLYYSIACMPLLTLIFRQYQLKNKWSYVLPFLFILPYQIAMYYSKNYTPVLQASTLIFSVPFLMVFFFSFIQKEAHSWWVVSCSLLIIAIGVYTLIQDGKIYERKFADFKGVSEHIAKWSREHKSQLIQLSNANHPEYLQYYMEGEAEQVALDMAEFKDEEAVAQARDLLQNSPHSLASLSFANLKMPLEVYEYAKSHYTNVKEEHRAFNSHALLLEKSPKGRDTLLSISPASSAKWSLNGTTTDSLSEKGIFNVQAEAEYVLTLAEEWKNLKQNQKALIISIALKHPLKSENLVLVASLENKNGSIFWRGTNCKDYYNAEGWYEIKAVIEPNVAFQDSDLFKVYLWNQDRISFQVKDFRLESFEDSDYDFYQ